MTTHNANQPAQNNLPLRLKANSVHGHKRGRGLGYPTINLDLSQIPQTLGHGIYACWAVVDGKRYQAAVHFGPRPVFKADSAFEVYLLDVVLDSLPPSVEVEVIERLRDVLDFPSPQALQAAIAQDVERTRAILGNI